jgi:hypothetical protein
MPQSVAGSGAAKPEQNGRAKGERDEAGLQGRVHGEDGVDAIIGDRGADGAADPDQRGQTAGERGPAEAGIESFSRGCGAALGALDRLGFGFDCKGFEFAVFGVGVFRSRRGRQVRAFELKVDFRFLFGFDFFGERLSDDFVFVRGRVNHSEINFGDLAFAKFGEQVALLFVQFHRAGSIPAAPCAAIQVNGAATNVPTARAKFC